jgi:hypothetical protein
MQGYIKAYKLGQIDNDDFEFIQNKYYIFGKKAQPYLQLILEVLLKIKKVYFYIFRIIIVLL